MLKKPGRASRVSSTVDHHYYPAFIDLRGKHCIVVGGGKVAERKVAALLRSGAKVTVISPIVTGVLADHCESKRIKHIKRKYRKGDLEDAFIVIAAASDRRVNQEVSLDAPFLLNVVDAPELANFIVPSVVKRGPLALAVSTSGSSPALAKSIRKELEVFYGKQFGLFVDFLGKQRKKTLINIADDGIRERLMKQIATPEMLGLLRKEGFKTTRNLILKIIKGQRSNTAKCSR
ncbi:MAG: bifunctional precorrin-2 dehydrogenase/sirohydrochlorin ferrochelatase [Dissulfurispiraceae bacterium]